MFAVAETTLFGLAAAVSTVIGAVLAILSYRSGAKNAAEKAAQDCHDQLMAAQRESEQLSTELHKLRMEQEND